MLRTLVAVVLLASLGANAWFIARSANPPARLVAKNSRPLNTPPAVPAASAAPAAATSSATPATLTDYRALQTTLQREGLSPWVAKVVLAVLLDFDFVQRKAALEPAVESYWRLNRPCDDAEQHAAATRLDQEVETLKRELGLTHTLDNPWEGFHGVLFGKLAAAKKSGVRQILADYREMEADLDATPHRDDDEGVQARKTRHALLMREMKADVAGLLTAAELREFEYLNDPAGDKLRQHFGDFEATEAEFVALFPQVQTLLATINEAGYMTVENQIAGALRQTLGEGRYQQMKEANDRLLQDARQFVAGVHLPVSLAGDLVAMEREYSDRRAKVRQDRDLSANEQDRRIQTLEAEKAAQLNRVLGPHAEAYSKRENLLDGVIGCGFGMRSRLL